MEKYNKLWLGLIPGLILPFIFIWIYLAQLFPDYTTLFQTLKIIYPSALFGKVALISILPDLMLFFVFYKMDAFKLSSGFMVGGIPYLIISFFML